MRLFKRLKWWHFMRKNNHCFSCCVFCEFYEKCVYDMNE